MNLCAKPVFVFLTSALLLHVAADRHAPEVHTKLGALRGQYVSVKGKETGVHAYLGVPFAKPPIGPALRLAAPQPVEAWEGVRDATQQPPMCIQMKKLSIDMIDQYGTVLVDLQDISEDCLYLNIYTPAKKALGTKMPVMVWIHGGGFTFGAASLYDGSALAAYQDMVVVLIQYRLGLLGFVSTGDEHMSGNFGMLDQVEALRWIQQHIHNFGGNPDLVTIFGESAGGMSVSLLLFSPLSDGLFHHAIAESGTAAMELLLVNDPVPAMQVVSNKTGCSLESTEKIADCIRNLDIDTILSTVQDVTVRIPLNVDGVFLTKPVDELYRTHELPTIPFMTGVNSDEGGWVICNFFAPPNWTEGMDREQIENLLFMFYPDPKYTVFRDLITDEYIGRGEDRLKNRDGFTKIIADMMFTIPAIKTANAHRDAGAPVYLYEYQHAPTFLKAKRPSFVGSDHGDEIFTVLGLCFTTTHVKLSVACDEKEEQLTQIMMSYWGNFARTGCPNGDGLVHWPKYGAEEAYLSIDAKEQATGHQLKKDQFVFLTQTLPEKSREYNEKLERNEL
ncbi:ces5a [Pungitius sinensis]